MDIRHLWDALTRAIRGQQQPPDAAGDEIRDLSAADDPIQLPGFDPEPETPELPPELRAEEPDEQQDGPLAPEVPEPEEPTPPELPEPEPVEEPELPDPDPQPPMDEGPLAGMVADDEFAGDPALTRIAEATDFSKIVGDLHRPQDEQGPFPEVVELDAAPMATDTDQQAEDSSIRQRVEMIEARLPDPYEPKLLPDELRHGVAQIDSNDADGAYTITEQVWNPDAGPAAWEDGVAPVSYVDQTARDYQDRDLGVVDRYVRFWEQRSKTGVLEVLIDVMGMGEFSWGKTTAAWTSGNTVTLDPCNVDEVDNGLANVTAHVFTPTTTTPGSGTVIPVIADGDLLAYIPYGDNLGVLINPPTTIKGQTGMLAVKCWKDGGTTNGDHETQCDNTYTVRTIDATGPGAGGALLGENLLPKTRQATNFLGEMHCPPTTGGGWIGAGYYDTSDTFTLFDSGEREYTTACIEE